MTLAQLLGFLGSLFFLGQALTAMLVYVWSRRSPQVRVNFFGLLTFQAPFLPWALMGFSMLLGNSILVDLLGEPSCPASQPAHPKLAALPQPSHLHQTSHLCAPIPTLASVLTAPCTSQKACRLHISRPHLLKLVWGLTRVRVGGQVAVPAVVPTPLKFSGTPPHPPPGPGSCKLLQGRPHPHPGLAACPQLQTLIL